MMIKKYRISLFVLLAAALFSCQNPNVEKLRYVKSWTLSFEDSANNYNIFKGDAATGTCYTRTNSKANFSAGIEYVLPDSLVNRDIRIYIDCAARRNRDNVGYLVLTFNHGDTGKLWRGFRANEYMHQLNKWERITDSTQFPFWRNNRKGITMKFYGWNTSADTTAAFDIDDLRISIKEVTTEKRKTP